MADNAKTFRSTRTSLNLKKKKRKSEVLEDAAEELPPPPPIQRVFLYIQLNDILYLPDTIHPLEIHLYHAKNTLQKMTEHYTTETIIYQHEFNLKKPTFTLTVNQDDIEDMNIFSDNPLLISLYQRIPRLPRKKPNISQATNQSEPTLILTDLQQHEETTKIIEEQLIYEGEGEEGGFDEERLEFISRGHCDLLQLFHHKRFIADVDIFLYPDFYLYNEEKSTLTKWHLYTVLPLMKVDTFTNLAFITLESIYNVNSELIPNGDDLAVNISFRSTNPDEKGEYHIVPLCNYYGLNYTEISEQSTSIVWESIKRDINPAKNFCYNQMLTTNRVNLPKLFRNLLFTEGVEFNIDMIDPIEDVALINNSVHRFVLNQEMCAILENVVVHDNYKLLVEVFFQENPEQIIYEGLINLSVLAYPHVQYVRFACALNEVPRKSFSKSLVTPIGKMSERRMSKKNTARNLAKSLANALTPISSASMITKTPTFLILKICVFNELTTKSQSLEVYNLNPNMRDKLLRCKTFEAPNPEDEFGLCNEFYRAFDEKISEIMLYMISRNVKTIEERSDYFCCQLANLNNILLKLCGCDFNVRMPTKNNIEFREMLTHMFKELINRIYIIVMSCGRLCLTYCIIDFTKEQINLINLMGCYKFLVALEETILAEQFLDQLKYDITNKILFNFFLFLHDIETLNFKDAIKYVITRKRTYDWDGEYFIGLGKIYAVYMLRLSNENLADDAYALLLDDLRPFADQNSLDGHAMVLLYCYYKQCNYLPGMEYTRCCYENLYRVPRKSLELLPISLYEMYINFDLEFDNSRFIKFYEVYKTFVRMGLYRFAEVIFRELQISCTQMEIYLISTVLQMLQKTIDPKYFAQDFKTNNLERGRLLHYHLMHINGNMEFERGNLQKAAGYFSRLLNIENESWLPFFRLSFLRLGKWAFEQENFELSEQSYKCCQPNNDPGISFIANYGLGKVFYYSGRLNEAIPYFSKCTNIEMCAPNVWGYLATINLRLGHNKLALDCWKIAKARPEIRIYDDVYEELDKINPSNVSLLVE